MAAAEPRSQSPDSDEPPEAPQSTESPGTPNAGPRITEKQAEAAARTYWNNTADAYQAEHGDFLSGAAACVVDSGQKMHRIDDADEAGTGQGGFVWGPEGITEADLGLLGPVADLAGAAVLEVGCGAAQCAHWLHKQGARSVGVDLAVGQLRHAPQGLPVIAGSAVALPFRAGSFDLAFSAYGAVQFVADLDHLLAEVHRVLRPGARFVFSVTHPIRWAFPDDPGPAGLAVSNSYFDRAAYVERARPGGRIAYTEFHRTLGDYSDALRRTGFGIDQIVEPEWPAWNDAQWGGWSPARGQVLPGTLILGCRADADRWDAQAVG